MESNTATGETRVVTHVIEQGQFAYCALCDRVIKFVAANRTKRVIVNVYEKDKWLRVENYHPDCYEEAGRPYGDATEEIMPRKYPETQPTAASVD